MTAHRGATKATSLTSDGRYPGAELYDALLARCWRAEADFIESTRLLGEKAAEVERLRAGLRHIAEVAENVSLGHERVSHWWYRQEAIRVLRNDQP